jgi:hypothetical protein
MPPPPPLGSGRAHPLPTNFLIAAPCSIASVFMAIFPFTKSYQKFKYIYLTLSKKHINENQEL